MAELSLQAKTPGVQEAMSALDKLSKAEQKLVLEGSAIGKSVGKSADRGHASLTKMATAAQSVIGGMIGIGSATGVATLLISKLKAEFEALKAMQDKAAGSQRSWSAELGEFISNNPQLGQAETQRWANMAMDEGQKLEGGPAQVLKAITEVRSGTPGATDEQQVAAIQRAVLQATTAPQTDIGAYATGIVKTQQILSSQGVETTPTQAHNLLAMMGARAGGSIADLVKQVGKLGGGAIGGETPMADVLSLFAFLTGELSDTTGEQTTTTTLNMLTRAKTLKFKMGGREARKIDGSGYDIIMDMLARIDAGEFGDKTLARAQFAKTLGGRTSGAAALAVMASGRSRLEETRGMIGGTLAGTGEDFAAAQYALKGQLLGQTGVGLDRQRVATGQLEVLRQVGPGAEWSRMRDRMKMFREATGETGEFDVGKDFREWSAQNRGRRPVEWEADQYRRLMRKQAFSMSPALAAGARSETVYNPAAGLPSERDKQREDRMNRMQTVPEWARYIIEQGGVSAEGGLSTPEAFALLQAGGRAEEVQRVAQLDQAGLTEAFRAALADLVQAILARPVPPGNFGDLLDSAIERGRQPSPQAGKDIDSL